MHYLPRYDEHQRRRHEVKPGITGWAQVNGRNAQTWSRRLELDVEYVDRRGFSLDLEILVRTVAMVVSGRGVSADGHETMPEFAGAESSAANS